MNNKKRNKTEIIIIVLAVLLILNLSLLAGTVIYHKLAANTDATVTVPDNLITPDEDKTEHAEAAHTETDESSLPDETERTTSAANSMGSTSAAANGVNNQTSAASISLYNRKPQDNTAFSVSNMFPGDNEVKYYRIQVSYHNKATVHFKADVRKGYEKLAEALKVRVKLLTTGETLYDGLFKNMPQSVTHKLTSPNHTTDELYYEITAYLDTSVGNEYQNKALIADFRWWVEETRNLDKAPQTGDTANIALWISIAITSATLCMVLLKSRKKEEEQAK